MGEKEKPWIRLGQAGSCSGRLAKDQRLTAIMATAITMIKLDFVILATQKVSLSNEQRNIVLSA
jgi:hypothetical protein